MNPKIAHGERKIRLFTKPSNFTTHYFGNLEFIKIKGID